MSEKYALDDHFLKDRITQVISERALRCVVETGIAFGGSSLEFCKMPINRYIGIDADPARISQTTANLAAKRNGDLCCTWELHQGNSPTVLSHLISTGEIKAEETLFFLDAHNWPDTSYWPFPDEVRAIPKGQGVLVLHDFHVPGKDFGVDGYMVNGQMRSFDYALIKDLLTEWSPTHRLEYMQEADPNSSYRGAAFVYPS